MTDEQSRTLLRRWQAGDEHAAELIFNRYVERLIALAKVRLSPKLRRRIDPEDVVNSAYRSFFRVAGEEHDRINQYDNLWKLLAGFTIKKLLGQAEFHAAGKRAIAKEIQLNPTTSCNIDPELLARDPAPSQGVAIVEEVSNLMRRIEPFHREILERRLQGMSVKEIALEVDRTESTVRRILGRIRDDMAARLQDDDS